MKPSPITTQSPAMTAPVTTALPLYHHISPTMAKPPIKKSRLRCAVGNTKIGTQDPERRGFAEPAKRRPGKKHQAHLPQSQRQSAQACCPRRQGSTGNMAPSTRDEGFLVKPIPEYNPRSCPSRRSKTNCGRTAARSLGTALPSFSGSRHTVCAAHQSGDWPG
jgi:hypothetical protein